MWHCSATGGLGSAARWLSRLARRAALGWPLIVVPGASFAAEPAHCLSAADERAAIASGKAVPFATVIKTLHRAPKDVIGAKLCQDSDRLIYVLTLLGRDGKVKRATVDAGSGQVVGER
jgi:hypothetical protein